MLLQEEAGKNFAKEATWTVFGSFPAVATSDNNTAKG